MRKVVLISGISSGFGLATARILADNDYCVYGTIRSGTGTLNNVHYLIMDLTDINSIRSTVKQVLDGEGKIDILINNGGMHTGGPAETLPLEFADLQMKTNFMGLVNLTREVLPAMRNMRGGKIINISSIGGIIGLPFQSFYSAAKFAVEGFSEALRLEVKKFGIRVVLVNPGDFNTNNTANRRNFLAPEPDESPYSIQFRKTLDVLEKDEIRGWKPDIMARQIFRIAESKNPRNRYIVASPEQKMSVFVKRLLPGKWFDKIMMSYYKIS